MRQRSHSGRQTVAYLKELETVLEFYSAALAKMKAALDDLDRANAPGDIGAHLDLAICRLAEILNSEHAYGAMAPGKKPAK